MEFFSIGILFRYLTVLLSEPPLCHMPPAHAAAEAVARMQEANMEVIKCCPRLGSRETESALKTTVQFDFVYEAVAEKIRAYAKDRDILLDGRFGFLVFPHAYRNYYCISSPARRAIFAAKARGMTLEEATKYIAYRDSFEKQYSIPPQVKTVDMDAFADVEDIVRYFLRDIRQTT